ncbi:MAG: hypothetical protein A3C30_01665 [Candidatus Levybacteria bacterium RIFCSPHIGHO2_02_FULL_40_18]|nr:MAG: hypothetical protein A2869_01230 [Candidatus Levybacteria bacterium RIFCSPHIGHO2_01_FULL_40_58]OGH26700.1 MAG: hypothetical protein A3C30_01665 [Candidatus Levybacteria bacterium RIFCSPHIGHO2_02_FULL_40_18]OGH31635.1 MAG: hypothetical protein A3E43_01385 [Candidatus Levybacteria bacterium RIFCSPHIGHO2_12_FULL_40_31]OGH40263.1 MAG: hypothetical protein A2894_02400 [Candidatus Levybacteria bacterium RIFCSPLOWO2_01_FULL_40_64]OGH48711.1 MAG: hypothetical protein A3I54_03560 [Candidatus Lev
MKYTISTKLFRLSDKDYKYIQKLAEKLLQFIPFKDSDYPLLEIVLRKNKKKSLKVQPLHGHEAADNPVYYDGKLDLILPKKRLVSKMLGKTVDEAIKDGFDELFRELETYKGLHFGSDSEYYDHGTVRGRAEEYFETSGPFSDSERGLKESEEN